MATTRLATLRAIEKDVQAQWKEQRVLDAAAPLGDGTDGPQRKKYLITFPYPYMNGKLHLGHAFSLTKAEFTARFLRMCGYHVLWPFGLHVTGTPIAACAQKLANEIQTYGLPPQFPDEVLNPAKAQEDHVPGKHTSKRGKTAPPKPQWIILQDMGIPTDEIPLFADARYWIRYFPNLALQDLEAFGCHIDYRRSFITTNANPFYDAFVAWQFRKLYASGYLHFGKRYAIYSPLDGQPCADHDRATGEGVKPTEYLLVKVRVSDPLAQTVFAPFADVIGSRPVILPGATLRPETVVGQTNVWVSPSMRYEAFLVQSTPESLGEVFLTTSRAARNLSFQGFWINGAAEHREPPASLFSVEGTALIGLPLAAPHAPYPTLYVLPMPAINDTKGTAVVISVPSDSPEDFINLSVLQSKADYRAKLGLRDEWVVPFKVVPIITIPGELGTQAAEVACKLCHVKSPKDADALEEAKTMVYQQGYYSGTMIVGPFTGSKVAEAKTKMAEQMLSEGNAIRYVEPTKPVQSRSGDDCVVALCDQWYLDYGRADWKANVAAHLQTMELYFPGIRNAFTEALDWLSEWPCSRTFGLGTTLPCDATASMIIDSLSDSTIYMAYYTIAHLLHATPSGGTLDGSGNENNITPSMVTDATLDFVFLGVGSPEEVEKATGLPAHVASAMRREFLYWYPVDLRVSAKDLIQNHLTMSLYNHAAIWDSKAMPRGFFCNGHIMVDGEKMSKSKGNVVTLHDAVELYSADATRLACAEAGDSLDDANFVREVTAGYILRLTAWIDTVRELEASTTLREGATTLFDDIMMNTVNATILAVRGYYEKMLFRAVVNSAFHELLNAFHQYRISCGDGPHREVSLRVMSAMALMLQPIIPHVTQYIWGSVLHRPGLIIDAPFPTPGPIQFGLYVAQSVIAHVATEIRALQTKMSKRGIVVNAVDVIVATTYLPWQLSALELMREIYRETEGSFPQDLAKVILSKKPAWLAKPLIPEVLAFVVYIRNFVPTYGAVAMEPTVPFSDLEALQQAKDSLMRQCDLISLNIIECDESARPAKCRPGQPTIAAHKQ